MTLPDGVHWHATAEHGSRGTVDRVRLRRAVPDAVLRSPWAVARWIDARTREHVHHREVYAGADRVWVAIGDEDDLEHLRQENCLIASRGDSIHTDIYSPAERHALYVEAVTDEQCTYGCSDQEPDTPVAGNCPKGGDHTGIPVQGKDYRVCAKCGSRC